MVTVVEYQPSMVYTLHYYSKEYIHELHIHRATGCTIIYHNIIHSISAALNTELAVSALRLLSMKFDQQLGQQQYY